MSRTQLGPLAAVVIVVLRLAIGLHFTLEGLDKLRGQRPFSSAGFLGAAKGPLAGFYKGMVFDPDGRLRLGMEEEVNSETGKTRLTINTKPTEDYWNAYRDRVIRYYGFDEVQQQHSQKVLDKDIERLKLFYKEHEEEIEEYYNQLARRDRNAQLPERAGMETLQTHDARIAADWMKLRGQLVGKMDALWKNVETDLNNVATREQREGRPPLLIGKLTSGGLFSTDFVDRVIPWFDLVVGLCLVLGLATRPAAILAGLFLLSVCASQWPGYPGATPIYYQSVEMLALFALAAIGAGRVAGIDALIGDFWRMCCSPKKEKQK